jgi:hypothetical protein
MLLHYVVFGYYFFQKHTRSSHFIQNGGVRAACLRLEHVKFLLELVHLICVDFLLVSLEHVRSAAVDHKIG